MLPDYAREYSQEPHPVSPKETSINGMDQPHRSSTNSPDGVNTKKTATLRNKLEGEIKFSSRGKSLSHSPTPGPTMARRRTASTDQLTPVKDDPPPPVQPLPSQSLPLNVPAAPVFVPPVSKQDKHNKEKKSGGVKVNSLPLYPVYCHDMHYSHV